MDFRNRENTLSCPNQNADNYTLGWNTLLATRTILKMPRLLRGAGVFICPQVLVLPIEDEKVNGINKGLKIDV
jgi:hypothetical protein